MTHPATLNAYYRTPGRMPLNSTRHCNSEDNLPKKCWQYKKNLYSIMGKAAINLDSTLNEIIQL